MSLNPTKCHYMYLSKNKEKDTLNFENISQTDYPKLEMLF